MRHNGDSAGAVVLAVLASAAAAARRHRARASPQFDRPCRRVSEATAEQQRHLARPSRLRRRRDRAVHVGPAQRRRATSDDETMQKSLDVSAHAQARADLRRLAANDGLLRRRAEERSAADPPATRSGWKTIRSPSGDAQRGLVLSRRPAGRGDPSNSQFALLALYEAERAGVKVNEKTWRLALQYWQQIQNPDGSWGYIKGVPAPAA